MRRDGMRHPLRGPIQVRLLEQLESRVLLSTSPIEPLPFSADLFGDVHPFTDCPTTYHGQFLELSSTNSQRHNASLREDPSAPMALVIIAGTEMTTEVGTWLELTSDILGEWGHGLPMEAEWTQLSGPGQATFSNPFLRTSNVTFDQPGTYEVQLTLSNPGLTAVGQVKVEVVPSNQNVIRIDQAWLAAQGNGPYYLNQPGKTYRLYTDVTTNGTAFAIIAPNVDFDLNGYTITYNNASPIVVANHSFEVGNGALATNWNFSNAPNAQRFVGEFLQNSVYDGNYSLRFGNTTLSGYIESTHTVTLEANTTYSLSGMFQYSNSNGTNNPGAKGYIQLVGNSLPTREASWTNGNNRGIQLVERFFTTGATPETYTVRVGVQGHTASNHPFYIDDVKIQRYRSHGISIGPASAGMDPDISQFGAAQGSTVRNGAIVQGQDGGTWSHALHYYSTNLTFRNLDITVHGANTSATFNWWANNGNVLHVVGNTITSNVKTISNRDNLNGTVLYQVVGNIENNIILNGPHVGIWVTGGSETTVHGNTIKLKGRYTNNFAIIGGHEVYNNVIESYEGDYNSRGIAPASGTAANPVRIYGNTIKVQQQMINQEYGGPQLGGVYGIQFEGQTWVKAYENDVTVYGHIGHALRFTGISTSNIHVYDNILRGITQPGGSNIDYRATPFSFYLAGDMDDRGILIEDNRLITNDGLVGFNSNSVVTVRNSHVEVVDLAINPFVFHSAWTAGSGLHSVVRFLDTTFEDSDARSYIENAKIHYGVGYTDRMQVFLDWTTTVQVVTAGASPVAGAQVSIGDRFGTNVYTGVTDASGRIVTTLSEFRIQGNTKTLYNQYRVTASFGGNDDDQYFDANSVQTLQLEL